MQLPEQIRRLEQIVSQLIDGFIKQMEQVRSDHQQRMKEYIEEQLGGNALRRRLVRREELDKNEATGDHFYSMLREISKITNFASPYSSEGGELLKRT